jgi:hypothetical protein
MPTTPTPDGSMAPKPPTAKQLAYLRALANRTGQTFTYPRTCAQASQQIQRLRTAPPSTALDRALETDDPNAIEAAEDMREIHGVEVVTQPAATSSNSR